MVIRSLLVALCLCIAAAAGAAEAPKVLRIASESETGFDPARVGDVRSFRVIAHIFEPLLRYDPLARPVKLKALTAEALPEPSADKVQKFMAKLVRAGIRVQGKTLRGLQVPQP